jgi:hypothetical protein
MQGISNILRVGALALVLFGLLAASTLTAPPAHASGSSRGGLSFVGGG